VGEEIGGKGEGKRKERETRGRKVGERKEREGGNVKS